MSNEIVKQDQNQALSPFDAEMARYAAEAAAVEQASALPKLTAKSGNLFIGTEKVANARLQVVVLDSIFENVLYEAEYDPENYVPPTCFAFAHDEASLSPHSKASSPKHPSCKGCPFNEYGTSQKGSGKGKACKNTRRLLLLSANDLSESAILTGDLVYHQVPTTSLKEWGNYVRAVGATLKRPPFAVVTEVACVPDPKTQLKVKFTHVGNLTNEQVAAVMKRREQEKDTLFFAYSAPSEKAEGEQAAKPNKKRKYG